MKKGIYHATSLKAAEREVRMLRKQRLETTVLLDRFARERIMLAKLASPTPQFFNPSDAMEAQKLRDYLLSK